MFLYSYFCGLNDVFLAEHFNKYWKIGLEFNYFLINTRKLVMISTCTGFAAPRHA
jgi:hypothetical protein